jgi:outer membrane murein-binding lipoprotein Lpp
MSTDISTIISLGAVLIAFLGLVLSGRKETRSDAAESARLNAKLDGISNGVEDIRVELRTMRGRVDSIAERLSSVEASCKSAHHRLDTIMKVHTPD